MRNDLDDLLNKHGSDKHSQNGYGPIYHALFKHARPKPLRLLEIGIGTLTPNVHSSMYGHDLPGYRPGASLRAWRDYFLQGVIYGIDVQPDTMITDEHRIVTALCDSTDAGAVHSFLSSWAQTHQSTLSFDIIIDDGSHTPSHQLATLRNFYPYLNPGGLYVIEDVNPREFGVDHQDELHTIVGDNSLYFAVQLPKANVIVISRR